MPPTALGGEADGKKRLPVITDCLSSRSTRSSARSTSKYWQDRLEACARCRCVQWSEPRAGLAQRSPLEGRIYAETIPFNETRDYVKKVLANAMFYARELDQPYVPLSIRLGTVPARGSASADTDAAIAAKAP